MMSVTYHQHKILETTFNEKLMYKVYVYDKKKSDISEMLCDSREQADFIAKLINSNAGSANVNCHSWCVLVED